MFESAELGHAIAKAVYKKEAPKLREALLDAQYDLKERGEFPVIILISGVDGAGKGETVNLLNEWMDPRLIQSRTFSAATDEERDRPQMWRFWRALPPKGRVGILFGSWYTEPISDRVHGFIKTPELDQSIDQIKRLEKMLVDEGALLLKFWFHLSRDQQRHRLKTLEKNPKTRWRVTEADWRAYEQYDEYRHWSEHTLQETSTGEAPWVIVEGKDPAYRSLTVGKVVLAGIRSRLDREPSAPKAPEAAPMLASIDNVQIIDRLDLTATLEKSQYKAELEAWQGRLNLLFREKKFKDRNVIAVFEGNDAAGKGGSIRRVTQALDARSYDIIPVAAPTEDERNQPYLWRFWRHMPAKSHMTIFDRSWYGRVLVERVEGYCSEFDWVRAYGEINDFETQLSKHGTIVVKFWLAISQDEQLRRFEAREKIGYKRFKITDDDWRNRKKWPDYVRAVSDMVERTSTVTAPWTLVAANDKYHARIEILRTLTKAIEKAL
ncbi:MAG: polyphosphate:AMP phosphotransferase [Candidatus Sericytochromatia bacterium]|nr:polyphosphate:AMP phosphotransferase [Candidatus Sericytochromatia bacterium]